MHATDNIAFGNGVWIRFPVHKGYKLVPYHYDTSRKQGCSSKVVYSKLRCSISFRFWWLRLGYHKTLLIYFVFVDELNTNVRCDAFYFICNSKPFATRQSYSTGQNCSRSGIKSSLNDVIISAMTSQITSLTIVYLTVNSGADQRKHHWPLWGEFTGDRWFPRTKGQ